MPEKVGFSGKGTIYSFTTVSRKEAPNEFRKFAPYPIALIRLREGPLVTAQLTDLDSDQEVAIGTPVEMVTKKLHQDGDERGMLIYGYKFRPILTSS